jgi:hypothetical protein
VFEQGYLEYNTIYMKDDEIERQRDQTMFQRTKTKRNPVGKWGDGSSFKVVWEYTNKNIG